MPKKLQRDNYRVVTYLRNEGDFGYVRVGGSMVQRRTEAEQRRDAEHIKAMILRHVNKFDDERGDVIVESDDASVCSHCGRDWTEDNDIYNGGCCEEDEKGNPDAIVS